VTKEKADGFVAAEIFLMSRCLAMICGYTDTQTDVKP
jgi:hypothetical protein